MRNGPLLQYFCSTCGKVLKESPSLDRPMEQVREECPVCGSLLIDSLQNRILSTANPERTQLSVIDTTQKPAQLSSTDFQTAYIQVEDSRTKFAFDILQIDSLLNLDAKGSLCIIGEPRYSQLLIDRLCTRSMLPKRHGGIGEGYSKIIAIDAGNCSDVYQIVNLARQYGLEIKKVLQNILVSRVFTIYQLAHLVIGELPRIIEQFSADKRKNYVIVIYGLLDLFVSDPHIDKADAKKLIKDIAASIREISEDRFVVVSTPPPNPEYKKSLFLAFHNIIGITNDTENSKILRVDVRHKNHLIGKKATRSVLSTRLCRQELSLVPSR
jgi:DNA-directed RNA polymerase subunit RPC12/RpoP